jgi:hypothetical protein
MLFKKISFYPMSKKAGEMIPPPSPSYLSNIPSWHKVLPKFLYGDKTFKYNGTELGSNLTAKSCLPLTDGFTAGYVFTLPFDIYTSKDENGTRIFRWSFHNLESGEELPDAINSRPQDTKKDLTGWNNMYGYEDLEYNWWPFWSVVTPPGYSCIFTHPINRIDLPFYTLGGIIDTDGWGTAGNHPFLIKKDWEGVISAGTPIAQIIPFKRQNWKHKVDKTKIDYFFKNITKRSYYLQGFYKIKVWKNKFYR